MLTAIILLVFPAPVETANQGHTDAQYVPLQEQLSRLLEKERGTYGIYLLDLKSGQSMGINHQLAFHAASTFKLPLNIYLYEQIAAGKVDPDRKLVYQKIHYEGGTGLLKEKEVGSRYDIETLARYSIVYSDNVATNMLLSYLGQKNVKDFMRAAGGSLVYEDKNITCPRDMALYMKRLLDFAAVHPDEGNRLIGYLKNTVFNERIPRLLPRGVQVAHKIGNWPPTGTYNDVGYIEHPRRPYILAIFSKRTPGAARAYTVISQISKTVYDYQNSLVNLRLNGRPLATDVPPLLTGGRVLVPVRVVAEALGAKVHWNEEARKVVITRPQAEITLVLGKNTASVNGTPAPLDVSAQIAGGRTLVPLRFVSEALGLAVDWDGATKTVMLESGPVQVK